MPTRAQLVPASCPVWAVRAEDDELVPADQSARYVRAAPRRPAGTAEEVAVPGDHFTLIADPDAPSFPAIEKLITEAWTRVAADPAAS